MGKETEAPAEAPAEAPVLVTREGPVVRAVLNRPARRNAMNAAMGEALDSLFAELREDRSARVLVLSGAGGHFCAGLDLTEVGADGTPEARLAGQLDRNRRIGERFGAFSALPQVVIAQVEGAAHAGGLGWVCAADIAFAASSARFAAPETLRGLVPAQILPWMVRRLGHSAATRMVLQGAVVDAAEALRTGLVHQVAPNPAMLSAMVDATVADILKGAPGALAETKGLLAALGPVAPEGYAEAGARAFARCATGPEAAEGIAAFREKRPPAWLA
ncbi:enoyl-CoA hydratase-related protein [Roseomonas sp. NAR14]|uniref:Enoyl-CoA hydratase-related protein n=1 Tax=Roseomonas acroporae TaxID=2937791 RepID=A0A9X2BVC5_9PROT|nr:enoyl-CoA hydratase-related protein [Roseomonas acroporae]MCK8784916.1 enoyl-CoA hydratase-related protein [Roseomonas acroporae]